MRDGLTQVCRRCDADEDVRLEDGARQIASDIDVRGQRVAGQVGQVLARLHKVIGQRRGVRPQRKLVTATASQRDRQRSAPRARSKNGDPAHAAAFFPNRFSVPDISLRMLA